VNPAVEDQATDRAYRIGQHRTVYSVKLITKGTVEEKVLEMQKKKKAIIDAALTQDEDVMQKLEWEDVQDLLSLLNFVLSFVLSFVDVGFKTKLNTKLRTKYVKSVAMKTFLFIALLLPPTLFAQSPDLSLHLPLHRDARDASRAKTTGR